MNLDDAKQYKDNNRHDLHTNGTFYHFYTHTIYILLSSKLIFL